VTPKQVESVREGLRRNVRMGGDLAAAQATADALLALLRRDWAVRVLDAWAAQKSGRAHDAVLMMAGEWWARVWEGGAPSSQYSRPAMTPDAARSAAADAVFPTLPEAVRAELGERP
jgi:hypothetical protein